ncbi:MAG: SHOCT domain-containing protein [Candidatus Gracilibacteria bacterium]|nr:SHOCT domain-containing protein [Candidatus Gracilibacteria bacterium]
MSLGPILWIAFCLVMLYFIVQWMKESQNEQRLKTPLDILKVRYAKGEITKEEFESMKKDLM